MKRDRKEKRFCMWMTETMHNELEEIALKREISKAQIIRELIRAYLEDKIIYKM